MRIPVGEALDLCDGSRRACVGWVVGDRPHVEEVAVRHRSGRFLAGFPDGSPRPPTGAEVVLMVDEGVLFFDLRALYVRGPQSAAAEPPDDELVWIEVCPATTTAWDYGRMRVVRGDG